MGWFRRARRGSVGTSAVGADRRSEGITTTTATAYSSCVSGGRVGWNVVTGNLKSLPEFSPTVRGAFPDPGGQIGTVGAPSPAIRCVVSQQHGGDRISSLQ